ncbi:methyltransferase domain-containing protein [Planomonospora parontospora]|uniref:methyltransferase domain-containing protein n=1 Tax=Planomonospora parontospora TaxID=58119 RepID=UPI001670403D|nr:methyltransferase domain-containing protein [Planomonospora parontospora]GGL50182.1 methyltransferase type 11 [Planomonospora parontospora subsp. antibiotica]GII18951.1 methyltransferase type 11 [Planomonospora parontospora subsp. antibiotica]
MLSYDDLVEQAVRASVLGWDFGWLRGRTTGGRPSWDYAERASALLPATRRLLDVDTGGGEVLASLSPLPRHTVAMEGWQPNVPVAAKRLGPMNVTVLAGTADRIPAREGAFDLVLNRHGALDPVEAARVLAEGGRLLTQQVGSRNDLELNHALGVPPSADPESWTLAVAEERFHRCGLRVLDAREEMIDYVFQDIGAVIFQLRAVPWQVPGFDHDRHGEPLRALHERIRSEGAFTVRHHRFLIEAELRRT